MIYLRVSLKLSHMEAPDPPASVVIEMSDSETLRGTLIEERTDERLSDKESVRLILVYPQDIEQIERRNESEYDFS